MGIRGSLRRVSKSIWEYATHPASRDAVTTQQQVHEYLANKRKQREQQQQPKETAAAATDERDEQIKELTKKVQLRETQMKTAANRVDSYGVAIDLGFDADKL